MFSFLKNLFKPRTARPERPRLELPGQARPPAKAGRSDAGVSPKAKEEWAKQAAKRINPGATPEQLCGIEPGMNRDQISAQLAILYRRHNRAASSLEASLREEAEIMLDVIATMRQKHLS